MAHLSPAAYCIRCFGSAAALADAIKVSRNAPLRWAGSGTASTGRGRTARVAGDIPMQQCRAILAAARARRLDVTEHDLFYGRDVEPVTASSARKPALVG